MSIEITIGTPGSGMTYKPPVPNEFKFTGFDFDLSGSLPCLCCGDPVYQDNLCRHCLDIMKEVD